MTLSDDIEDLQRSIQRLQDFLEQIDQNAQKLLSCPMDELSSQMSRLSESLEEFHGSLRRSQEQIQDLGDRWGGSSFTPRSQSSKQLSKSWKEPVQKLVTTVQIGTVMLTNLATQGTKTTIEAVQDVLSVTELIDRLPPQLTKIDEDETTDKSLQDLVSLYEIDQTAGHESLYQDSDKNKKRKMKKHKA